MATDEPSPTVYSEELEEAASEVLASDDPLLTPVTQEVAALADEEHPLGVPGTPILPRSPMRVGFAAAIGVLAALALAAIVVKAAAVLILIAIAAPVSYTHLTLPTICSV